MVLNPSESKFIHEPVMVNEIVSLTDMLPAGYFLDATLGGAGHASKILATNESLKLIGVDRDPIAISAAKDRLQEFKDRVTFVHTRFDQLSEVLEGVKLSGFLFDLGISSPQIDNPDRGFSYKNDGPLDMRMNQGSGVSAHDVVNSYEFSDLTRIIRDYSDEKFAARIANAIIAARPINRTTALAEIIVGAIPAATRRKGGHPAKRTFQAIRIEVNDELSILEPAITQALNCLDVDGKGFVLTYHSGEDKIIKSIFRSCSESSDPPGFPEQVDIPNFSIPRPVAMKPSELEITNNRRASSARLRTILKVAA